MSDVLKKQENAKVSDLAGSTVQCILENEDKIKDENGKKRARVQLSLDFFLSRKE
jgi:hypothetical protein